MVNACMFRRWLRKADSPQPTLMHTLCRCARRFVSSVPFMFRSVHEVLLKSVAPLHSVPTSSFNFASLSHVLRQCARVSSMTCDRSPGQTIATQSSPEQPRATQSSSEQPRAAQSNPKQPTAAQSSPQQTRAAQTSLEQPRKLQQRLYI